MHFDVPTQLLTAQMVAATGRRTDVQLAHKCFNLRKNPILLMNKKTQKFP
jgi:hypothetical protein